VTKVTYRGSMKIIMSLDLLTRYIDQALMFERMAEAERNLAFKVDLQRQASAYRRLAANRAKELGLPLPRTSSAVEGRRRYD
jgi:hypothetical protein